MTPLVRLLSGPSPLGRAAMKLQRYRVSPTRYQIPGRPYCDDPVFLNREEARPSEGYTGLSLEMYVPCRKCAKCLLFRQLKWAERIEVELARSPRTWFATLTFAPIHLAGVIAESYRLKGSDQTTLIERAAFAHVQLYFKRLRKSGARFRYYAIPEYGEAEGRLHYHVALHETLENSATKRVLQQQWRSFTHVKLVRQGEAFQAARYLSKYLTKQSTRPRASIKYGRNHPIPNGRGGGGGVAAKGKMT